MIRWVITGPIGSGKSAVSDYLFARGAALVNGDQLGHEVLERSEVVREIVASFGPEVAVDGRVDRSVLGPKVFGDPVALERLNSITHLRISLLAAEKLDELAQTGQHELAVLEAAMYFLFPSPPAVDLVLAVVAAPDVRAARLKETRGLNDEQIRARLAAQTNLEPLWYQADVIMTNETSLADLHHQIDQLLDRYLDSGIQG